MNELIKKTWVIFFLIIFCNSIFAGINPDRLYFADTENSSPSKTGIVFDRGNGCMTTELPEESVNALWKEILIKGFSVDTLGSDQPENLKRETLDKNQLLLTEADAKAGDMAIKKEIPSQLIDPLEVPMLIGKTCQGAFSYGANLKETLRVGRCTGKDADSECYLADYGQYRQNGMTGFLKETKVVGKDLIKGLKDTLTLNGDSNSDSNKTMNEDLGAFTDISSAELEQYYQAMEASDSNSIETETWKSVGNKVIENTSFTTNFAVTMQTTCRGENCYINTYSLFDKMFNQYFSLDMVYSATSPVFYNTMARIVNNTPLVKKGLTALPTALKKKGIIKEGGFIDTLTKDPGLFIQDPFGRIKKSFDAGIFRKSNVDNYVEVNLKHFDILKRDIQNNDIQDEITATLKALQDNPGATAATTQDLIIKNSAKLNAVQKRAYADVMQIYQSKFAASNALLKSKIADGDFISAKKIIDEVRANGEPIDNALRKLTKTQLDAYEDAAYTASTLSQAHKDMGFSSYSWQDGFDKSAIVADRKLPIAEVSSTGVPGTPPTITKTTLDLKTYKSKDGHSFGELLDKEKLGTEFNGFRYKTDSKYGYVMKDMGDVQTIDYKIILADGTEVTRKRLKTVIENVDRSIPGYPANFDDLKAIAKENPNAVISYLDGSTIKEIKGYQLNDTLKAKITSFGGTGNTTVYTNVKPDFVDNALPIDPSTIHPITNPLGSPYAAGALDTDPLETMASLMDTTPGKLSGTTGRFDEVNTALANKEWVTGRGRDFISQQSKIYNGAAYQRFFTRNPLAFGINFGYWQFKTMGNTIFGETLGLTEYSMYQLPETYSALQIKHKENAKIYDDAYVDFFANDGSDQGDLFMAFLNSGLMWANWAPQKIIGSIEADWAQSLKSTMNNITQGQIKRSKVDDIVLITNNINSGCNQSCNFSIASDYLEKNTKNASMAMELQMIDSNAPTDVNSSTDVNAPKNLNSSTSIQPAINYNQIKIDSVIPQNANIKTTNYLLENTSDKNLKNLGQTLISFSHHTDYDGTVATETTEKAIDLLDAQEQGNTCSQKVTELALMGLPIGRLLPKSFRNYRLAAVLSLEQHFAYVLFPGSGYFSSFLGPAIFSDLPQQFLIMPELKGCVDDEEGLYSHFFVSAEETDRIAKDSKNKVGEAIIEGTKQVETAVSKITSGTDLEKGVKFGSEQVQKFAEEKLQEDPIVQSTYTTAGATAASVEGQLFFFEIGPRATCRASGYNDKGVEVLMGQDSNGNDMNVRIDKEKGELTVTDANGTRTIIGGNNKDFVRLMGDNFAIPAKVIPHSLSYIPTPNDTLPLFEIDAYGNLSVKNAEFFDCLRAGYEAQTGLTMSSSASNLTEYLGAVKLANVIHPSGAYTTTFSGDGILAQGAGLPRELTSGNNSKATILGNRFTKIGPIDGSDKTIGQNVAIQFEKGQLVYYEDKQAYILWVENTTITHGNDIAKLKTEITKEQATNGCDKEELGIQFSTTPVKDNDQAKANTDKLNKALEKVGPFQMFDTPTKTFIFYISDPPECKQRLKIIDKETGVVTDSEILSFEKTPNGISVKTADGSTHNLEFTAEDGVPKLTYNGDKETLTSAQGKNGSFWFDPETGNWYTTNGNLIPLNDKFKDGVTFAVNPNGTVTGTPEQMYSILVQVVQERAVVDLMFH
ncbi:MAG: hypothetical protein WC932_05380 [archaeon]|jgi:hypothetical protein